LTFSCSPKWKILIFGDCLLMSNTQLNQVMIASSYGSLFLGATLFKPYERIWKSWAPPKCWLFLWLTAHKRCWTSDHLTKCGLPHPDKCPMCDQEDETIDHLLVACMFARQFWYHMLRQVGLHSFAPEPTDSIFYL
jgi:hypothetical protein